MKEAINPQRRRLPAGAVGAIAWVGLGGVAHADLPDVEKSVAPATTTKAKALPDYANWKDLDSLIVHSANTIETKRSASGSGMIAPLDRLFVRNNVSPPSAQIVNDPDAWTLEISGVKNPRSFTVAELKTLGLAAVPMVLQCSGNGRSYFPHKPSGTQWVENIP